MLRSGTPILRNVRGLFFFFSLALKEIFPVVQQHMERFEAVVWDGSRMATTILASHGRVKPSEVEHP